MRTFKIGEICVHKGYICRVDASERQIIGVTCPSAYGFKDGTELNPTLTLTPLYGPSGDPIKNPRRRKASSGAVDRASEQISTLKSRMLDLELQIERLESLTPENPPEKKP